MQVPLPKDEVAIVLIPAVDRGGSLAFGFAEIIDFPHKFVSLFPLILEAPLSQVLEHWPWLRGCVVTFRLVRHPLKLPCTLRLRGRTLP